MPDQENYLSNLLDILYSQIESKFHEDFVIFVSSAIVLNGIKLNREINDLDVFVSEETFNFLGEFLSQKTKDAKEGGEIYYLEIAEKIEVLKSFPGVEFDEVYSRSKILENSRSFRVGALSDLRTWKVQQDRCKDRKDVQTIDRVIGRYKADLQVK